MNLPTDITIVIITPRSSALTAPSCYPIQQAFGKRQRAMKRNHIAQRSLMCSASPVQISQKSNVSAKLHYVSMFFWLALARAMLYWSSQTNYSMNHNRTEKSIATSRTTEKSQALWSQHTCTIKRRATVVTFLHVALVANASRRQHYKHQQDR